MLLSEGEDTRMACAAPHMSYMSECELGQLKPEYSDVFFPPTLFSSGFVFCNEAVYHGRRVETGSISDRKG